MDSTNNIPLSDKPERFKLAEIGYIGSNLFDGVSKDELKSELNFPNSIKTFKQMSYHGTINAALTLYESLICKADWVVRPPENATDEEKDQTAFIKECMSDMDHTWTEFIKDALSMNIFGFSLHEKVYRKRLTSNGSKFNDGKIGWKKLPIRTQESIKKFIFSENGNELVAVKQNISALADPYGRYASRASEVTLPISKVLLFRTGRHRGDPYGKSPLRDAYLAWRYLVALEEIESNGVAKDLVGMPILYIPPQYLSSEATPEQKVIRQYYERAMANLQMNQQSAMILPNAFDPETKQPLFKLDLLSVNGTKGFDTTLVKEYYKNLILTSLFADILVMGQSSTGSFALGQVKNSLTGTAVEALVRTIKDVINRDLVRQTYELNGWNTARACTIDYDNMDSIDAETFSKAIQRIASVGFLTQDLSVVNKIRQIIGVDVLPEDADFKSLLTDNTSKASAGMSKGSGNGTSDSVAGSDTSASNADNAA
jgi:hypothetical protein